MELKKTPPTLTWAGGQTLRDPNTGQQYGMLPVHISNVMTLLSESIGATFQVILQAGKPSAGTNLTELRKPPTSEAFQVSVIVYGPSHEAVEVGEWLDKCNLFLQEPERCDRNVPYRNPQSLSFDDQEIIMTFEIENMRTREDAAEDCHSLHVLADLGNDDLLEEAEQPAIIATPLHRCDLQHAYYAGFANFVLKAPETSTRIYAAS